MKAIVRTWRQSQDNLPTKQENAHTNLFVARARIWHAIIVSPDKDKKKPHTVPRSWDLWVWLAQTKLISRLVLLKRSIWGLRITFHERRRSLPSRWTVIRVGVPYRHKRILQWRRNGRAGFRNFTVGNTGDSDSSF